MGDMNMLGNHLWQSTVFAAVVALIALTLRRNRAELRYWLWMTASMKFLMPFSALTTVGRQFSWMRHEAVRPPEVPRLIETIGQPFTAPASPDAVVAVAAGDAAGSELWLAAVAGIWFAGTVAVVASWSMRWRRVSAVLRASSAVTDGDVHDALRRIERRVGAVHATVLASSDRSLEPGVFGIWRPVLLWPRGIEAHLDRHQVEAILVHEVTHVRRRDNLTAALHMVVEAIFWFHPLVWWIGTRLVHERERSCDEAVVRLGTDPHVYAESVLKTCRFSIEAPLACMSGVTGSDLRRRIELIMRNDPSSRLTIVARVLLIAAAFAATTGPVVVGALLGERVDARAEGVGFEGATVRPNTSGAGPVRLVIQPEGRFSATNVTLRMLTRFAYDVQLPQIVGGPEWLDTDRFDIAAKAPNGPSPDNGGRRLLRTVQSLLSQRFRLSVHREARAMPSYALVPARGGRLGPNLSEASVDCTGVRTRESGPPPVPPPPPQPGQPMPPIDCGVAIGPGMLNAGGVPMSELGRLLSLHVDRIVVDKTGLSGRYTFQLRYAPEQFGDPGSVPMLLNGAPAPTFDPGAPGIFTALQEQLGLKLEARHEPVDVLVIDSVEKPMEN